MRVTLAKWLMVGWLMVASAASADVYVRTNLEVSPVSGSIDPLSAGIGDELRLKGYSVNGGVPYNLTNTFIRGFLVDSRDELTNQIVTGSILDSGQGIWRIRWTPTNSIANLELRVDAFQADTSNFQARLAYHNISFTNSAGECPDVTVQFITVTNSTIYTSGVSSVEGATGAVDLTSTNGAITFAAGATAVDFSIAPGVLSGQVNRITTSDGSNFMGNVHISAGTAVTFSYTSSGLVINCTAAGGGETNSYITGIGWLGNEVLYSSTVWYHFAHTNYSLVTREYDPLGLLDPTNVVWTGLPVGFYLGDIHSDEADSAAKTYGIGALINDVLQTNTMWQLKADNGLANGGTIGFFADIYTFSGSQWNSPQADFGFFNSSATNRIKLALYPWQGSKMNTYQATIRMWRGGALQ